MVIILPRSLGRMITGVVPMCVPVYSVTVIPFDNPDNTSYNYCSLFSCGNREHVWLR